MMQAIIGSSLLLCVLFMGESLLIKSLNTGVCQPIVARSALESHVVLRRFNLC